MAYRSDTLRDFSASPRLLLLAGMALIAGTTGAFAAFVLLKLIALFTNLAYLQRLSFDPIHLIGNDLPLWTVAIPVIGSIVIGLMARFGSEKIRGHGIPEAIEAILIGQRRIEPKVAILKPLSSAIAIGTGGPFGAEGPIIMTGGALSSLFAQLFDLSSAERKTLLVAGAAAGMTAVFGTPLAAPAGAGEGHHGAAGVYARRIHACCGSGGPDERRRAAPAQELSGGRRRRASRRHHFAQRYPALDAGGFGRRRNGRRPLFQR
jgi:H+/Cl- antiporter ClcA